MFINPIFTVIASASLFALPADIRSQLSAGSSEHRWVSHPGCSFRCCGASLLATEDDDTSGLLDMSPREFRPLVSASGQGSRR